MCDRRRSNSNRDFHDHLRGTRNSNGGRGGRFLPGRLKDSRGGRVQKATVDGSADTTRMKSSTFVKRLSQSSGGRGNRRGSRVFRAHGARTVYTVLELDAELAAFVDQECNGVTLAGDSEDTECTELPQRSSPPRKPISGIRGNGGSRGSRGSSTRGRGLHDSLNTPEGSSGGRSRDSRRSSRGRNLQNLKDARGSNGDVRSSRGPPRLVAAPNIAVKSATIVLEKLSVIPGGENSELKKSSQGSSVRGRGARKGSKCGRIFRAHEPGGATYTVKELNSELAAFVSLFSN